MDIGLLVNRGVIICATSPDGIFALFECKTFIDKHFVGLCVLEIKTKTTVRTATRLDMDNVYTGKKNH